jgi:hypothetical protein
MNHPSASFRPACSVTVEYTARGRRVRKTFADIWQARRFYAEKHRAGADPRIVLAVREN